MFESQRPHRSMIGIAFRTLTLIYHATVRSVRSGHGNALVGLAMNVLQTVVFVGVFYAMFELLGMRGSAIAGADFLLYTPATELT